jgi:hypothetical protein
MNVDDGPVDRRVRNWNHLLASEAPFQIKSIKIIESDIFASQTIGFSRVLALVGLHGTGKTLLLRLLEAAFGRVEKYSSGPPYFKEGEESAPYDPVPIGGVVEVSLRTPQGIVSRIVDLSLPSERRKEIWKNEFDEISYANYTGALEALGDLGYAFGERAFLATQTAAADRQSKKLSVDELRAARNILGCAYDEFTVDTIVANDTWYPYFWAKRKSKNLDYFAMSNGELWVHYVLNWWLSACLAEESLALIDEPETFLAARGRRPFMDQIAARALQGRLQIIVATHSPEILGRFPLVNIRMCLQSDEGIRVVQPGSMAQIQDVVGMSASIRMLVLVEDDLAKEILLQICSDYDASLTREIEIVPVGGASKVKSGLEILGRANQVRVVGVLDGDERDKFLRSLNQVNRVLNSSVFFLPGDVTPEEALLSVARTDTNWIAEHISRRTDDVVIAINSCQSLDHQYQIGYLASQLGLSETALTFILISAWLRDECIRGQAEELIFKILAKMKKLSFPIQISSLPVALPAHA